ncbi:hypothetical protein [Streptomyces sp. NPDC057939]|uniref:hypothetical protein n=1 Tax=Streptomyces sp. NPDC057939 TaxID=3346284 RepID=UPI0036E6520D
MAEQLITALSMTWNPEQFHDTFQEKVAAPIDAKQAGASVEKVEPATEPTGVVDLAEALSASAERAASPKATGGKATASGRTTSPKKPAAAKKRIRPAPKKEDLDGLSKGRPLQGGGRRPPTRPLTHDPRRTGTSSGPHLT